jgi:hypothetical protein
MFSGSYDPNDVIFLLKPIEIADTPIREKERLIQTGARHYSEMITRERVPSPKYMQIYHDAVQREAEQFASDLVVLAGRILAVAKPIVLVSLARAGTPVGVLLNRILRNRLQREVPHYSISIIRDRGIDLVAMQTILALHPGHELIFIDGWTGKGVIAEELASSIRVFNDQFGTQISSDLYVVADLSGTAAVSATHEDYLIPSCILGATVSGLISRSILNQEYLTPTDYHGCLYYHDFEEVDESRRFVDVIFDACLSAMKQPIIPPPTVSKSLLRQQSIELLQTMKSRFGICERNFIKPGIGESTRVLLRRVPDRLLLRDDQDRAVDHLIELAEEKCVPIDRDRSLPYRAVALIQEVEG